MQLLTKIQLTLFLGFLTCSIHAEPTQNGQSEQLSSLSDARHNFKTVLRPQEIAKKPAKQAPADILQTIKYPATAGEFTAYLSLRPSDNKKHPAIIWITGLDCNSIGDVWTPAPRSDDRTEVAFRKEGIVMMFPSLRGGNDNPGIKEGFFGEVDDVLAALDYLQKLDYVDPEHIYLGGHSTGGTLALLVAEYSDRFRSVFSFGPIADISKYGTDSVFLPFETSIPNELKVRSPIHWLSSVKKPTWVFEGTVKANINALRIMAKTTDNPNIHFIEIKDANHFSGLAPTQELIAKKIIQDTGELNNISITEDEVNRNFIQ